MDLYSTILLKRKFKNHYRNNIDYICTELVSVPPNTLQDILIYIEGTCCFLAWLRLLFTYRVDSTVDHTFSIIYRERLYINVVLPISGSSHSTRVFMFNVVLPISGGSHSTKGFYV